MNRKAGRLRIEASGYQYTHWRGAFYPPDLPKKDWFAYNAQRFDTVEINNTFYRLPQAHTFEAWRDQAPEGFCYALKFSRYAAHLKRLNEPHAPTRRFLERASRLSEFIRNGSLRIGGIGGFMASAAAATTPSKPSWRRPRSSSNA